MRIALPRKALMALVTAWGLTSGSCFRSTGDTATAPDTEGRARPRTVLTVSDALRSLAGHIAGERVTVRFPAPDGADPTTWIPDDGTIAAYQEADLVLLDATVHAGWTDNVSLAPSRLVDTCAAFRDRLLVIDDEIIHAHGPTGEHAHRGTAFTTCLDPRLAILQARAIEEAFSRKWPRDAETFRAHLARLEQDLLALDQELEEVCSDAAASPLLASHPVYSYLGRRYGLNLRSVAWEPHEIPSPDMWEELEGILEGHPARWMLWEADPLALIHQRLGSLGVRVAVIDPALDLPAEGDLLDVLRRNVKEMQGVFTRN